MTTHTIDNASYYRRTATAKRVFVYDYVRSRGDIGFVFDVGCNNGIMSYPLHKELGKKVLGIDLSGSLSLPRDYEFRREDIVTMREVIMNDCTLFLSLYHHILGNQGIDVADDVFYRLLLRTRYLIFDSGNLSETKRQKYSWYPAQKQHFNNEKDLLDHFGLPYEVIGTWDVARGRRSVVVFKNESFATSVIVLQKLKRKNGSRYASQGLFPYNEKIDHEWDRTVFHKLRLGSKTFFAKKHVDGECQTILMNRNETELKKTIHAYNNLDPELLIKFYGWSDEYGLIFEWVDNMKYIKKMRYAIGDVMFKDVDLVEVDGQEKIIDFHW